MALVNCKECGEQVSKKADSCPKCGAPLKRKPMGCGTLLLILLVVGGIASMFSTSDSPNESYKSVSKKKADPNAWKTEDNSYMAYIMMEDFVESRLKAPKTADFPGLFDGGGKDHVTRLENQTYVITSYVDSQNSFGANIRTRFTGQVKQIDKNNWRLISLTIE